MSTEKRTKLEEKISQLPLSPGVYLFKDRAGNVLYVGKAKELRSRVRSYFRTGSDGRYHIQFMLSRIHDIDFTVTENEQEALILENNLIKKYRPRYNIFLRDDKTYVNLRMNIDHPYPRLTVVRNPRRDKALYFGPFSSAGSVRRTLRTIGRVFPLRLCSDAELKSRRRPCLYYDIKMCPAPCVDLVDPQEYRETVNKVVMFLKGRGNELVKSLRKKMELASAERRYEDAARIRDQISAIEKTLEKQRITSPQRADRDVFAACRRENRLAIKSLYVRAGEVTGGDGFVFDNAGLPTAEHLASFLSQYYQRGAAIPKEVVLSEEIPEAEDLEALLSSRRGAPVSMIRPKRGERRRLVDLARENAVALLEATTGSMRNRELLEDLRSLLELRNFPRRIECFDVSNIGGKEAVASRVAYIDGEPARELYRRYRVKTVEGVDDYCMMEEVLRRRISRGLKEGDLPDVLAVDGGRGQLNVALRVLEELGAVDVDAVAIAKVREGERGRKIKGKEKIYTRTLPQGLLLEGNSKALYLLERVRDEAHRFAITYHRLSREKRLKTSLLEEIPGVGPAIKAALLERFGDLESVSKASLSELRAVRGVSRELAERIRSFLGEE